jgi:hypothetical protein
MNFIEVYPNALSLDRCQLACERMDAIISRPNPGNACILSDDSSRTDWNIFTKKYSSLYSSEDAIVDAVWNGWRQYNKKYGVTSRTFPEIFAEGWKFQRSSTGGGFHTWHYEQGSGESNRARFGVWMIYLNTVETGGKTEFKFQDLQVKPEAGTLVIWPATYTHLHRAAPDLVGDKYIATGWFNFPSNKDAK